MRVMIVGILVLALAVAGVSTYLIKSFSTPEAIDQIEAAQEPVRPRVLVATKKLNRGEVLTADSMRWQFWPEDGINKFYIVVEKDDQEPGPIREYANSVVRHTIEAGDPILPSKVFKDGATGVMAGILEPGMRAVAVPVQPETGAGGFILPGDRVDILLAHNKAQEALRMRQSAQEETGGSDADEPMVVLAMTTETILRDIPVLAIDGTVGEVEGTAVQARTVTLQLTPKQAEIITTARTMGQLSLVLRSMGSEEVAEAPRTFTTDVEVSPFLSNMESVLAGEREGELYQQIESLKREKEIQEQIAREQADEIQVLSNTIEQGGTAVPESVSKPKTVAKDAVVKIYRGGANLTEELKADGTTSGASSDFSEAEAATE